MNKFKQTKEPFALRSPIHGFVAMCALAVIDGWWLIVAVLLAFALTAPPAHADPADDARWAAACQADVAAVATLDIEVLPIEVQSELRRDSVAALMQDRFGVTHSTNGVVLGHTVAPWDVSTELGQRGIQHQTKAQYCYKPTLTLTLGYKPIVVSVASEVQSPCALDYIVAHEQEHVKLYVENLPVIAQALRAEIEPMLTMAMAENDEEALAAIRAKLHDQLGVMIQAQVNDLSAKHALFDQHDVEHMKAHSCYKDILDISRAARRALRNM